MQRRSDEIRQVPDWARVRLELALDDAAQGRLDGVVGHYLALRGLAPDEDAVSVCAGLRALGRLLGAADEERLGAMACETAALLEEQLAGGMVADALSGVAASGRTSA